jgi:hypothetical protein
MRRLLHCVSPAMVVACLALFVALTGTSVAVVNALPKHSVGTAQLKNNAVVSSKVKDGSLQATDFAAGQLPAGKQGPAGTDGQPGPPGPAGPSDAYSRWANGLSGNLSLTIPQAGKYVIWAKAYVGNGEAIAQLVTCNLQAGGDYDKTVTRTPSLPSFPATSVSAIFTTVVHEFSSPGSATFSCSGSTSTEFAKIVAIRVGNLTNTGP